MPKQTISIEHFAVASKIQSPETLVMIGQRGTGRFVLMKDLIQQISLKLNFNCAIAFTSNKECKDVLSEFLDDAQIHDSPNESLIGEFIDSITSTKSIHHSQNSLIVLSDCFSKWTYEKDVAIRKLIEVAKEFGITIVVGVERIDELPEFFRNNCDYAFAFEDKLFANRNSLFKTYFSVFENLTTFDQALSSLAKNRQCLVVDTKNQKGGIEDCVYWYKANNRIPHFSLGGFIGGAEIEFVQLQPVIAEQKVDPVKQKVARSNCLTTSSSEVFEIENGDEENSSLDVFNLEAMKKCPVVLIVGKKGTGKLNLIKDIVHHHSSQFDGALVFTEKKKHSQFFKTIVRQDCVFEEFDAGVLNRAIENQKALRRNGYGTRILIVISCFSQNKEFFSSALAELIQNGRHLGFFVILYSYDSRFTPTIRINSDYVFALPDNEYMRKQTLFFNLFGVYPNKNEFINCFDKVAGSGNCLMVDNTKSNEKLSDCVKQYHTKSNIVVDRIKNFNILDFDGFVESDENIMQE